MKPCAISNCCTSHPSTVLASTILAVPRRKIPCDAAADVPLKIRTDRPALVCPDRVPTTQCAMRHTHRYAAMQGRQKLPEPARMHRRCNGKFGKCLEMSSAGSRSRGTLRQLSGGAAQLPCSRGVDSEHDLPPMRTAFHIRMSLTGALQREHLVDDGLELAAREHRPDDLQQLTLDVSLKCDFARS